MDAIEGGGSIISRNVQLHKTAEDSKRLAGLKGPAVVSEYASTTLIHPEDSFSVANTGELIITVGQAK